MRSVLLSQPLQTKPFYVIPRGWQWFKHQQMLALVYASHSEQAYSTMLTFVLLDTHSLTITASTSVLYANEAIETLHIVYMPQIGHWLLGSLGNFVRVHRFVCNEIKQDTSTHVLFEDDGGTVQASIGPICSLLVEKEEYSMIYLMPDFTKTRQVWLNRGNLFTSSQDQAILEQADSALVCTHADTTLLLALHPRWLEETTPGWGLRLSCYQQASFSCSWRQELDLYLPDVPTPPLTGENDLEWLGINATIIPGQLSQEPDSQSWIVGATMVDIFQVSGYGHSSVQASLMNKRVSLLAWLDATGQELWRCSDSMGLRLLVCQVGSGIAGIDLFEGQWRLWIWQPEQNLALQQIAPLDQKLLRAHVLSDKSEKGKTFWLIEEFENGVNVSHYTIASLYEAISTTWLADMHLVEQQNGNGSLNWHEEIDAWIEEDTLFLICLDEKKQPVLFQVE